MKTFQATFYGPAATGQPSPHTTVKSITAKSLAEAKRLAKAMRVPRQSANAGDLTRLVVVEPG